MPKVRVRATRRPVEVRVVLPQVGARVRVPSGSLLRVIAGFRSAVPGARKRTTGARGRDPLDLLLVVPWA
eukprot:11227111-Heterocapsa_arctica.AAC.1